MFPDKSRLFDWDDRLAIISPDGRKGFVLNEVKGWRSVLAADISWDGRSIDEAEAVSAFGPELERFGAPPISARHSSD